MGTLAGSSTTGSCDRPAWTARVVKPGRSLPGMVVVERPVEDVPREIPAGEHRPDRAAAEFLGDLEHPSQTGRPRSLREIVRLLEQQDDRAAHLFLADEHDF